MEGRVVITVWTCYYLYWERKELTTPCQSLEDRWLYICSPWPCPHSNLWRTWTLLSLSSHPEPVSSLPTTQSSSSCFPSDLLPNNLFCLGRNVFINPLPPPRGNGALLWFIFSPPSQFWPHTGNGVQKTMIWSKIQPTIFYMTSELRKMVTFLKCKKSKRRMMSWQWYEIYISVSISKKEG